MSTGGSQDKQRVILSLTVEIQDGREEHIQVKEGDSAEMVAKRFVGEHGLPHQFQAPLAELIVDNIIRLSKDDGWRREKQRPPSRTKKEPPEEEAPKPSAPKNYRGGRKVPDRLLAPTYTFRAKTSVFAHLEPRKKARPRSLTEKEKALFLRLHMDFVKHQQKIEDGRKLIDEQYMQRVKKSKVRMSKKSKMIMRVRSTAAKEFKNYGELLYQEGLNKAHERELLIQKKRQEEEANELVGVTLTPKISKMARMLKNQQVVWKRLRENKNADRLKQLRAEAFEAQLMECTFKPRINEMLQEDKRAAEDEKKLGSRFDQLFWDAEIRRRRQAEYAQWYPEGVTFRPSIAQSQRTHPDTHEEPGRSVFDRLVEYAERMNAVKQKLAEEFSKPIDPVSGQELFTPMTGRKPMFERNASLLPIGEFLYQMFFDMDHKRRAKVESAMRESAKLNNLEYALPRSVDILSDLEKRSMRQIFDYLDQNKNGTVNLETAVTDNLMDDVIEDLEQLKESGEPVTALDYNDFVTKLTPIRQAKKRGVHLVLRTRRVDDPFKAYTFRFRMSPYSRALAVKRRQYKSTGQWYKILGQERGRRHTKVEDLQKDLQKAAMQECTFKPVIHSKKGKSFLKAHYLPKSGGSEEKNEQQEVHGFIFQEDGK